MKKYTLALLTYPLLLIPYSSVFSQTITTFAGTGSAGYNGDNIQATAAEVNTPSDMATDKAGNIYLADFLNSRIREVNNSTGIITTVAGNGIAGYGGDGGPATSAEVFYPTGIAIDTADNIYVADYENHRVRLIANGIITTVAGNGTGAYNGDNIPASTAELQNPEGVSSDDSGNVYIADTYNYRIRKISKKTGFIYSVAGNGTNSYSGDGGMATSAEIGHTEKVKSDGIGNIYVPDEDNSRVRYVDLSTGIITTIAGNGISGLSGNGGPATSAEIASPEGVTLDAAGNMYFADISNNLVQMVNKSTGIISRVVGIHLNGFSGDGGPALLAEISAPVGVHIDNMGNMYLADNGNQRYRKISPIETSIADIGLNDEVTVYPVPNSGIMTVQLPGTGYNFIHVYDAFGREVYAQSLQANAQNKSLELNISNEANGVYFLQITTQKGMICKRVAVVR